MHYFFAELYRTLRPSIIVLIYKHYFGDTRFYLVKIFIYTVTKTLHNSKLYNLQRNEHRTPLPQLISKITLEIAWQIKRFVFCERMPPKAPWVFPVRTWTKLHESYRSNISQIFGPDISKFITFLSLHDTFCHMRIKSLNEMNWGLNKFIQFFISVSV